MGVCGIVRAVLSNMGCYGAESLKPTQLFGTVLGPEPFQYTEWAIFLNLYSIRHSYVGQYSVKSENIDDLIYRFVMWLLSLDLRPWMHKMVKKTSNRLRAKLKAKQEKSDRPVVKKTINKKTGKVQVSVT